MGLTNFVRSLIPWTFHKLAHHLPFIVPLSLRRLGRCKCMQIYTSFRTPKLAFVSDRLFGWQSHQHCCVIASSVLESSFVRWVLAHFICESHRSLHHKRYVNFSFCKRLAGLCYTDMCENTRQYSRTFYTRYGHAILA